MAETKIIDERITHFISQMMSDPVLSFNEKILSSCVPEINQYVSCVKVYDWGESVDKLIINTGNSFINSEINKESFRVFSAHSKFGKSESAGSEVVERTITDIYFCDSLGNRSSKNSCYIAIELFSEPGNAEHGLFEKMLKSVGRSAFKSFIILNDEINLKITKRTGTVHPLAGNFFPNEFKFQSGKESTNDVDIKLQYLYFRPENNNKIPLIIWLHGISEGGVNPYIPLMKIPAINLADKKIQGYFENGAALLIPQCPVSWLQTTDKDAMGNNLWAPISKNMNSAMGTTLDVIAGILDPAKADNAKKSVSNTLSSAASGIFGKLLGGNSQEQIKIIDYSKHFANVSLYTSCLKELIDKTISENPQIDKDRIYIGGCSAGGYMTMNMILQYPDFFAAAFPVCEVYPDSKITDSDIRNISDLPLWFSYSAFDTVVNPKTHSLATYNRILNIGGHKVHICEFQKITDITGKYNDETGRPHEYSGHESWIYVLNDFSEEDGVKLFDWLSKQTKKTGNRISLQAPR